MNEQMKQNLNRMVDRINSLREEARKLRRMAIKENHDDAVRSNDYANEKFARVAGILEAIEAIAGCQPARKMPEDIYLHF